MHASLSDALRGSHHFMDARRPPGRVARRRTMHTMCGGMLPTALVIVAASAAFCSDIHGQTIPRIVNAQELPHISSALQLSDDQRHAVQSLHERSFMQWHAEWRPEYLELVRRRELFINATSRPDMYTLDTSIVDFH